MVNSTQNRWRGRRGSTRLALATALLAVAVAPRASLAATDIQVAPTAGTGSAASVLTLDQAVAQIDKLAKAGTKGVTVHLAAGVYRLDTPLKLNATQGGEPDAPVVFEGPSSGQAVLSGGRVVDGFEDVHDAAILARLPAAARGHVLVADLHRAGVSELGHWERQGMSLPNKPSGLELIYRGSPATLARWPNTGFAHIGAMPAGPNGNRFGIADGHFAAWAAEPELQVSGYWSADWADETIPVESIDAGAGILTLRGNGPLNGMKSGQRIFVENALSELDSPGEWYLDRASARIYFWPPAPLHAGDVEVSVLDSVLDIEGASHVRFHGVDFESTRGDAVIVNGGSDVVVANARIRSAGGRGVAMTGHEHRVVDCDIYDTGQGGIALSGGDRQTLSAGGLSADGNRLYLYARLVKTYRPAIQLRGVGNMARGNLISQGPHSAILFYGNDHIIEFNDISDVARETGDVGAIYTGTDWTARGTEIRNNFVHDVHGPGAAGSRGIYLDDQTSGDIVSGNLLVRADRGLFLGGGRDNVIENNMFVDDTPAAIHLDSRGLTYQSAQVQDPHGQLRRELTDVPFDKPPYSNRYPGLANILKDNLGRPQNNKARDNIVLEGKALDLSDAVATSGLQVDALFGDHDVQLASGKPADTGKRPLDFKLAPQSDALAHGFQPLPLEGMECVSARWKASPMPGLERCFNLTEKQR